MQIEIEEVIEKLKSGNKTNLIDILRTFKKEGIENFVITRKIYLDTVLNYIETMHKEFDRLEGIEDNTAMLKQELIEAKEHNRQLAVELEKKDKIINEMAKMINSHDIDEDVCKQMGKSKECNDYVLSESNCIGCIIEYFTNKVEKEGK